MATERQETSLSAQTTQTKMTTINSDDIIKFGDVPSLQLRMSTPISYFNIVRSVWRLFRVWRYEIIRGFRNNNVTSSWELSDGGEWDGRGLGLHHEWDRWEINMKFSLENLTNLNTNLYKDKVTPSQARCVPEGG
jgi:hypothetical protein